MKMTLFKLYIVFLTILFASTAPVAGSRASCGLASECCQSVQIQKLRCCAENGGSHTPLHQESKSQQSFPCATDDSCYQSCQPATPFTVSNLQPKSVDFSLIQNATFQVPVRMVHNQRPASGQLPPALTRPPLYTLYCSLLH